MSLKQEIETWVQALAHYDNQEYEEAIKIFDGIPDTSKILFNCGVIYATLGEHEKAVECYQRAIGLDQYLAIAYFQEGVSNFLLGDFEEALANFNDTLLYLRGNTSIDYDQLGLKFRLYSCEVLFNRGLCYIYLQQMEAGLQDLEYAAKEKVTPDHDVINEAIKENAEGYTVFSIPVGVVYRPNEAKVKNLKTKDYLGKARLVAASDRNNMFTGFQGYEIKKSQASLENAPDDRPPENISFAATNLVHKNLVSRSRQQSEPPLNRNTFPPTPPPDSEKGNNNNGGGSSSTANGSSSGMTQRAASVRSGRPPRLDLMRSGTVNSGRPAGDNEMQQTRSRIGTTRAASESRGPPSRQNTRSYGREGSSRQQQQQPQYRETPPQWRGMNDGGGTRAGSGSMGGGGMLAGGENEYADEVYDLYSSPRTAVSQAGAGSRRAPPQRQAGGGGGGGGGPTTQYIDEEDEYASDVYEEDGFNDGEFEMVGASARMRTRSPPMRTSSRRGAPPSSSSLSSRRGGQGPTTPASAAAPPAPLEIRKFRVKVHAADDTRYIMVGPDVEFGEFEGKIREKFGFRSRLRIKMQDEGDMITMGDQDDLELLLLSARDQARREGGGDMGKMEIWVEERLQ